jgi:hypothetical protein
VWFIAFVLGKILIPGGLLVKILILFGLRRVHPLDRNLLGGLQGQAG